LIEQQRVCLQHFKDNSQLIALQKRYKDNKTQPGSLEETSLCQRSSLSQRATEDFNTHLNISTDRCFVNSLSSRNTKPRGTGVDIKGFA